MRCFLFALRTLPSTRSFRLPAALRTRRGERSLEARGVDGPFEISTRHKDITLTEFRNSVNISTTNGNVRLATSVAPTQAVEVEVRKGEISLALPEKCSFRIDASSRHGEVESAFSAPSLKLNQEGDSPSITGSYGQGGEIFWLCLFRKSRRSAE